MFLNKIIKDKLSKFYIVFYIKDANKKILTITTLKSQAEEYLQLLFRYKHNEHYVSWLALRNISDSFEAWQKYYNACVLTEEKQDYIIKKIFYKKSDISSMLRMFCGCVPIGCSFDTQAEYLYLDANLNVEKNQTDSESQDDVSDEKSNLVS